MTVPPVAGGAAREVAVRHVRALGGAVDKHRHA
jgi:hypothetical protein